jgi:serine/threonine-protein kinase HipA
MGRRSHSQSLSIWSNGQRVGLWTIPARGDMQLQYDPDWQASELGRPLSLSLQFNIQNLPIKGDKVLNYFDNLLPDSEAIRKRVAERFKTGSIDAFDLLKAIGRDCVGAVQLLGEHEEPENIESVQSHPVSKKDIESLLIETVSPIGFGTNVNPHTDLRISIAGAQEKTALLRWKGKWCIPQGSTPTTHILKLPLGLMGGQKADFTTSVDNEWLCMNLLKAYGLPVANVDIETFGTQRVLVVERFDRKIAPNGEWIMRLPQEDFCQVTGMPSILKYESDGGPGLQTLFNTLQQSENSATDLRTLMATQILFWLLRAPDGHAKNFSVQLLPRGRFRLAPLYDVMSAYPVMGKGPHQWSSKQIKLSMALLGKNRHYSMDSIVRRHFKSTAKHLGYEEYIEPLIEDLLARTPAVIERVSKKLPDGFSSHVAETVLDGLEKAVKKLGSMPTL